MFQQESRILLDVEWELEMSKMNIQIDFFQPQGQSYHKSKKRHTLTIQSPSSSL